ncbi:hypothetical protein [Ferruginibacter sp. SUN106]|uniref:hypothetical protein n=1 Tax=Ferruginibacter sp. SUN106 TaxID=2978348 RepID=UPI003D35B834
MITKKFHYNITMSKKADQKTWFMISGLVVINLLCYYFFEPKIIGHNIKYVLYFLGLPLAAGILFLAYIFRSYLLKEYKECRLLSDKILVPCFFLLMGLFFSYLTFGLAGDLTWVYLNKKAAEKNQTQTITCNVNKFTDNGYKRGGAKIFFTFQNRSENFTINNSMYKEYKDVIAKNYQLKITGRKGIWNYFIVDSYELEEIDK